MISDSKKSEMMKKLKEIQNESATVHRNQIITAISNGEEILKFNSNSAKDCRIMQTYLSRGYWVVNNFYNGKSRGKE